MNFISSEIERQNSLFFQDIPIRYKPIFEKVLLQYSSHFSLLEIVKQNIEEPSKIRPKIIQFLENRQFFLNELKKDLI